MLSSFKRVLPVGKKVEYCLTSFRALRSSFSAKDLRPPLVNTFPQIDSRDYSTSRSNLNLNLNLDVAKLKSKLEGEGFSSKEAELITLQCVKAIDDRLNTVANFRVDVQEIEKLKEVSSKLKFELQMLLQMQEQLTKPMFRRSYHRMSYRFKLWNDKVESRFSVLQLLFSEVLSDWRSNMMMYTFVLFFILAVGSPFMYKKSWLSFGESASDDDSDDDLVEPISPF